MLTEDLAQARTYRDFLKLLIEKKGGRINFSGLTRKAGFSSRSFIREVIEGKKSLTNFSLPKIIKAFDLTGSEKRFFECLVAIEESQVEIGFKNQTQAQAELEKLKRKSSRGKNTSPASLDWAFKIRHIGEVYAALGDLKTGAAISDIQNRTQLPEGICREVVNFLLQKNAVIKKGERYVAHQSDVDLFGLGQNDFFKRQYLESLELLQKRARQGLISDEELYFSSMVSIRRSRLPEFKSQLKELMLNFLDDVQEDNGDKVAKLTLGFHL